MNEHHFSPDVLEFLQLLARFGVRYVSETVPVYYIGLGELIKNKEAVDRDKDRDDLRFLKRKKQSCAGHTSASSSHFHVPMISPRSLQ